MKATSQFARDYLQDLAGKTFFIKSQRLSAIARVVWTQNVELANILLRHSRLARDHLVCEEGFVWIDDQDKFSIISDDVHLQLAMERISFTTEQKKEHSCDWTFQEEPQSSRTASSKQALKYHLWLVFGYSGQDACHFWNQG